jgi:hypothetical protein
MSEDKGFALEDSFAGQTASIKAGLTTIEENPLYGSTRLTQYSARDLKAVTKNLREGNYS